MDEMNEIIKECDRDILVHSIDVDSDEVLAHYGIGKLDGAPGRGSGRYPLGSGKDPYQDYPEKKRVRMERRQLRKADKAELKALKKEIKREKEELVKASEVARLEQEKLDTQIKKKRLDDMKNRRRMTMEDLRSFKSRLELERDIKKLVEEDLSPGKKWLKDFLKDQGTKALGKALENVADKVSREAMNKLFKSDDNGNKNKDNKDKNKNNSYDKDAIGKTVSNLKKAVDASISSLNKTQTDKK